MAGVAAGASPAAGNRRACCRRAHACITRPSPHSAPSPFQRHAVEPAVRQPPTMVATTAVPALQNEPAKLDGGDVATFDMAAARSSARAIAREDRKGMAALALSPKATGALTTDQIQQRLEQARRGNCLKANDSMNLLANVVMLARDIVATAVDDSGCKW
jgi:hypothetical protein